MRFGIAWGRLSSIPCILFFRTLDVAIWACHVVIQLRDIFVDRSEA